MVAVANSSRIRPLGVGVLLLGILPGICDAAQPANTNSLPAKLPAAIEKVLAIPRPGDRLKALAETARQLSLKEIPDALETAKGFRQLRERAVFHEAVLKRWSELAPGDAFGHVAALPESRIKVEAIRFAARQFATLDCDAAARAAQSLNPGRSRNEAVEVIAGVWARQDVAAALRWANTLPAGFARESALHSIRFVWVHSDPVSAAKHVAALPPGDTRNALLTNIAGEWAAFDPPAALRWANGLDDGPEKELVLANIAETWADNDPVAAGAFARTLSGNLKANAVAGVLARWATQNPEAAMNWALNCGAEAFPTRAFSDALNLWASVDASQAGVWVERLAPGPMREAAIQSYVAAVSTWEPAAALRLANTLQAETARLPQVENCLQRWIELDRSGARKWIETNALPQELKTKWLAEIKQGAVNPVKAGEK